MTKRLSGSSNAGKQFKRDPNGWYVEPESSVDQLFDLLPFEGTIWDPSCGRGTILNVARRRGFSTMGSDIVDRYRPERHQFTKGDFRRVQASPLLKFSIVNNPPYNEPTPDIAEEFVEHAIRLGGWERAAFLVPVGFQSGQRRYEKFFRPEPRCGMRPSHIISLCERPSMPPGEMLEQLGESCRGNGMEDYIWIVFTRGGPWRTEHLFAKPTNGTKPKTERRVR